MAKRTELTDETYDAALAVLKKRIATPAPKPKREYSKRELFLKLKAEVREALAKGHSLQVILDDLKGVGLGLAVSSAQQYLKPGKKRSKAKANTAVASANASTEDQSKPRAAAPGKETTTPYKAKADSRKGTFEVVPDTQDI